MSDNEKISNQNYRIKWIPVRNLAVVWTDAQRKMHEPRVREIIAGFDPNRFDPIRVTLPDGNGIYHVCDGQKRVKAVGTMWGPDEMVPSLVDTEESCPARAAEIFLDSNSKSSRQDVSAIDFFLVSVVAERKVEVAINKIVQHCGYHVDGSHKQDTIAAVEALRFVYRKSPKVLDQTLRVLRDTWGGEYAAVRAPLIKGYGSLICEFSKQIDHARLRDAVKKSGSPGKLLNEAKSWKENFHTNMTEAVMQLLCRIYNHGLGENKKLRRKGD